MGKKNPCGVVPNGRMLCSQAPFCKETPCSTKDSLSSGETQGCKNKERHRESVWFIISPLKSPPAFLKEVSGYEGGVD